MAIQFIDLKIQYQAIKQDAAPTGIPLMSDARPGTGIALGMPGFELSRWLKNPSINGCFLRRRMTPLGRNRKSGQALPVRSNKAGAKVMPLHGNAA